MSKEQKYYTDKSTITGYICDFINLCQELGRDWEDEIADVLYDAKNDAGVK